MAVISIKAQLAEALDLLSEAELQQVADYVTFIRFRARLTPLTPEDEAQLAALYKECAADDSALAEMGMDDYVDRLHIEDQ